ncbi:MAG: hypothetical protein JXA82_13155 [Sedimentisphaerales bacterium]|nr:hypothetical protein [Sedimentisphaerales bacterium]
MKSTDTLSWSISTLIVALCLPFTQLGAATYSGGMGTAEDPYQIATAEDLITFGQTVEDYDKHFVLTTDIDMGTSTFTTAVIAPDPSSSQEFEGTAFIGTLDGAGHIITNLSIDTSADGPDNDIDNFTGLFGMIGDGGQVMNLGFENATIAGDYAAAALAGENQGVISNCYATGEISGRSSVGVLVGYNNRGSITNCHIDGSVTGQWASEWIGGLVGRSAGSVLNCSATGTVSSGMNTQFVGGLMGYNYGGSIVGCFSSCEVTVESGNYSNSIGGLLGFNSSRGAVSGSILNSYATGDVSGTNYIGGLVGYNRQSISCCYSTGKVSGDSEVGGLIGYIRDGSDTNCFWDTETSETTASAGGTGLLTGQMQTKSTFIDAGWDFITETTNGIQDHWRMCTDGTMYPHLSWEFSHRGDLTCPDGVGMDDVQYLTEYWLEMTQETIGTADANGDGRITFEDFALLSENWLIIP